jgi:AbrB family looped-hinge helix DNA binding protein
MNSNFLRLPPKSPGLDLEASLSNQGRLVVPRAVRARLGLKPGDKVRFIERDGAFLIERISVPAGDDPFAGFSEWASVADDEAFRDL